MFERDWFCWREFAAGPGRSRRRIWISHPSPSGFAVRSQEREGPVTEETHGSEDLADSIEAHARRVASALADGLYEQPRPRVFERARDGERHALLVRYPTDASVEWAEVPWGAAEPLPWQRAPCDELATAFREFDDRCRAARDLGFRDWVPVWPQGFEAFVEAAGYAERAKRSDSTAATVEHRWYDAPERPETGPELWAYRDGTQQLLFQIDGQAAGISYYFDAERCVGVVSETGPTFHMTEGPLSTVVYKEAGVHQLILTRKEDGWESVARDGPRSWGPFDVRAGTWPDVAAALAPGPSLEAFRRGCEAFARAYELDRARAEEALALLVEGTREWPIELRAAPPYWLPRILDGELPVDALRPISALRLLDLAIDARDCQPCTDERFEERLSQLAGWLGSVPGDETLAVDVLDASLDAWEALPPRSERIGRSWPSFYDFDPGLFRRVLESPLCARLQVLNVSRSPWTDSRPGNHGSYELAAERSLGPLYESFGRDPVLIDSLARLPCAATLRTLVARNAQLRPPGSGRLPALITLDVGRGSHGPNDLLGSLATGWAPRLETLRVETSPTVEFAIGMESDPDALAEWSEDEDNFFGHDYCCEPDGLLLTASVVRSLAAREGAPKLRAVVLGAECARAKKLTGTKSRLFRKAAPAGGWLERAVVPW